MHSLKLAAATQCFSQSLKTSLLTAAEIGVVGVQLDARAEVPPDQLSETGRRQFRHHLDELTLDVSCLKFPARRTFYDQEYLEPRMTLLKETMKLAWDLKTRVVTSRIGKIPDSETPERLLLHDVMSDLAVYSNQIGVVLAVTPTNDSPEVLKEFLESITLGPLGVNFDPATFVMSRHHPGEAFRVLYEQVLHVQIRDGVREVDGGGIEVPVGRGEVDWDEVLALLDEADYAGWMSIERSSGDDKRGDMARAVSYLRRVAMG